MLRILLYIQTHAIGLSGNRADSTRAWTWSINNACNWPIPEIRIHTYLDAQQCIVIGSCQKFRFQMHACTYAVHSNDMLKLSLDAVVAPSSELMHSEEYIEYKVNYNTHGT